MSDEKSLSELFEKAIGIDSLNERARFVHEQCGDDAALRAELEMMLQADGQVGDFMEEPPSLIKQAKGGPERTSDSPSHSERIEESREGRADSDGEASPASVSDKQPTASQSILKNLEHTVDVPRVQLQDTDLTRVEPLQNPSSPEIPTRDADSRYQLQGEIARGGMGVIIKGRDVDLGRELAIKVLQSELKDRPEVIQRFIEEAQIGGQLQHPGIAPVYEFGQFSDQRPFFSMKLVKGETLSKLLSERENPTQDRARFLGIFEQICQTLGYAHARGVIHRDLKPANVMVGAFGEVQVMDWGLAKVLPSGGVADEKAAHTKQKQTMLRTRRSAGSDGLGLAGSGDEPGIGSGSGSADTQMGSVMGTPAYMPPEQALGEIDQLNQRSDVFGLGAILCEILTGQPPYVAEDATAVFRMASRAKLDDAYRRLDDCGADEELIALAKQCLAPEPEERPADAGCLADRISNYLEAVETKLRDAELAKVDAQVRAEELVRRQRLAFRSGAAVVATLLIGISVSAWQAVRATRAEGEKTQLLAEVISEEKATKQAREDAEDLSRFLSDIFKSPDPNRDGREIKVVDLLDMAAKKLEADLETQPNQRGRLQAALGKTYSSLGVHDKAIPLQEQVHDFCLTNYGQEHPATISAMYNLAESYRGDGRYEEALQLNEQVVTLRNRLLGPRHRDSLVARLGLTSSCWLVGRQKESLEMMEALAQEMREVLGPENPNTLVAISNLAGAYSEVGRLPQAIRMQQECLRLSRKVNGPGDLDTLIEMYNLSTSYSNAGRYDEAVGLREECLALSYKVLGAEHPITLSVTSSLAGSYRDVGRLVEALEMGEDCLELSRKVLRADHPDTQNYIGALAAAYREAGRLEEAIEMLQESVEQLRNVVGPDHPSTLKASVGLANAYHELGRNDESIRLLTECRERLEKSIPAEHPALRDVLSVLATSYKEVSRIDEAIAIQEKCLERFREVLGNDHPSTMAALTNLANSYNEVGRHEEANPLFQECLEFRRRLYGPDHPKTLVSLSDLASYYHGVGRHQEAISLRQECLDLHRKVLGDEHQNTVGAITNLATSYVTVGRHDEAITLNKEAVEISRKLLGSEHPRNFIVIDNLAFTYQLAGRFQEALALQEPLLEKSRQVLGDKNAKTLKSMSHLARLYMKTGRRDEAVPLMEECLRLQRQVLGLEHPQTLESMIGMASLYIDIGRSQDAITLGEEALELHHKVLGPEHPQTLTTSEILADAYAEIGRLDKAVSLQEECLRLNRKVLRDKHPQTLSAINRLAVFYSMVGRHEESIPLHEELLPVYQEVQGDKHPNTLGAMTNLALTYKLAGQFDKAISLQEQTLKIKRQVLPPGHPFRAVALRNLAEMYLRQSRSEESAQLCEELLEITPDDPEALNYFALLFSTIPVGEGDFPNAGRALELARKANAQLPDDGTLKGTLGIALYRNDEWKEAINTLQDSNRHGYDSPANLLFLAMSHWQLGEKDEAKQWHGKSLAWKAEHPDELEADADLQTLFAEAAKLMGDPSDKPKDADKADDSAKD